MEHAKEENPYVQFNAEILNDWKKDGVKYIKVIELDTDLPVSFFELIPDSEIPDSDDTIYPVNSDDIKELLEHDAKVKFLVHRIYLEEE